MVKHSKPLLDSSSPPQAPQRELSADEARREAVARYNEATFGERRPIVAALTRFAICFAVAVVAACVLPRHARRPVVLLVAVAFVVWEARKDGVSGWLASRDLWPRR